MFYVASGNHDALLLQAICKKKAPQINTICEKIETATYELLTILLPDGADDLEKVFTQEVESIKHTPKHSMAGLEPVIEVEEEFKPGEIAHQRQLQKKRELYQEASDLIAHFNRRVLDALIRCTRSTLERIKKRVSSPSTMLYGDTDEKRKMDHRPAFKVKLVLTVPQISLKPGLDEIQSGLNSAVQQVVAVTKSVYQWKQGGRHASQPQPNLTAASGVLAAKSGVLAAKSGLLAAKSGVLAAKSGVLASKSGVLAAASGILASASNNFGSGAVLAAPPKKNFFKSVSEHKEVAKLISMISSTISSAKALVTQSLDHFKKYEELWTVEKEEHMTEFMKSDPDLSDVEGKMKTYMSVEETVVEEMDQMDVGSLALLTGVKVMQEFFTGGRGWG